MTLLSKRKDMSKILYCIAQFAPKNGKFNELFKVLKALEPDTLREDGCLKMD